MFDRYELSGYTITTNPAINDKLYGLNENIRDILQQLKLGLEKKTPGIRKKIVKNIKKYPQIPQLKNLLTEYYILEGNIEKAYEINRKIVDENPDYVFAKINLASEYLHKEQLHQIPFVLGEFLELKKLYPNRNEFHIQEFMAFNQTAIMYLIQAQLFGEANKRINLLVEVSNHFEGQYNETVEYLKKVYKSGMKVFEELKKENERLEKEKVVLIQKLVELAKDTIKEAGIQLPDFENKQICELYYNSLRISDDKIKEILSLPRESLISDLHKVLNSLIDLHYDYYNNLVWHPNTHEFVFHALFLLVELKSYDSLDIILNILRQDQDFLEYWFCDFLTDGLWKVILQLGVDQKDKLLDFVFESNIYLFAKSIIPQALAYAVNIYPERRDEIVTWFAKVLDKTLETISDDDFDDEFLEMIIPDVISFKGKELLPLIKKIYDSELFISGELESYEEVVELIESDEQYYYHEVQLTKDIYELYKNTRENVLYYKNNEDTETKPQMFSEESEEDEKVDLIDDELQKNLNNYNNQANEKKENEYKTSTKVGRNEPCPCGSGKKYKKCCRNK